MGKVNYDSDHDQQILIIFLFLGVAVGAFITFIINRYAKNVPYTIMMFVVGGIAVSISDYRYMGHLGESINSWKKLDPEMILFLFLPILIFGEAMSLKWHHIKGALPQALLLAGPGVLIGAFTMGIFVYGLSLDWNWNLCMLFASIVAATDPVAVVGLLKSTSTSPKLTMLIVGESLLNDGTAMVLFTLYFEFLKGHECTGGFVIGYFFKMAVGSPLFGVMMGLLAVHFMSYATKPLSSDDVTVQIAITLVTAYMTFFLAEYELHISGLLACVAAGSMIAWKGPPLILQHESMHQVWGIMEWLGNTLLFLMAGCIIGSDVISTRTGSDWGYLVLLYIVLNLLRALTIFVLYPLLSRVGLKCSQNDAAFMAWTGLRGALGMALALIVKDDREEANISEADADRLFFFVGGLAALTLVINATTAEMMLQKLGLLKKDTPDKILVMEQIRKRLRARLLQDASELQAELRVEDINDILQHNSLLKQEDRYSMIAKEGGDNTVLTGSSETHRIQGGRAILQRTFSRRSSANGVMEDLMSYVRNIFLDIVRVEYWRRIDSGRLPRFSSATESLLYSIDNALDNTDMKLGDWECLKREMKISKVMQCGSSLIETLTPELSSARAAVDVLKSQNEEFRVYVLTNFMEAHEVAQKKISGFMGLEEEAGGMGEQKGSNGDAVGEPRIPETAAVMKESMSAVGEAREMLSAIDSHVINLVVCRQAGRALLSKQVSIVTDMIREGLLSDIDANKFLYLVNIDHARLAERAAKEFRQHVKLTQTKRIIRHLSDKDIESPSSSLSQSPVTAAHSSNLKESLLDADAGDVGIGRDSAL